MLGELFKVGLGEKCKQKPMGSEIANIKKGAVRNYKKFDIEKPNISEEQAVREELDRVLVPVDEDLVEKTKDEPTKKD